ncbi:MAG: hypothetical protein JNL06_05365, partial [Alphaproteobacteria bacterium]|nr:hypothetical protein [Alphaproteobacteria bacterium]
MHDQSAVHRRRKARAPVVDMTAQAPTNGLTVWRMLSDERGAFGSTLGYSLAINLLGLTSSLYMLQVYDRVLTSYSFATL